MSTVNQTQDYQGAYNSAIKTVWYLIALSFVLSFIGVIKIGYGNNGGILPFFSPNTFFIITVMSAISTVGCFIGERAISSNRGNLKSAKEALAHSTDVSKMREITIFFFVTFLIFFAITPVSSFAPILLNDRTSLVIFACVPILLTLAVLWLKMAITIQQKYLNPK